MKRAYLTLFFWLGLCLCTHARVLAHDPVSVTAYVSNEPDDVVLATSRGLMFGRAGDDDWTLLCSEGFGVSTDRPYTAALLPSGRLLVAGGRSKSFHGLRASDDRGCTFREVESLGDALTPAMVQHPTARGRVYVATFGKGASAIQVSDDGGTRFDVLWKLADEEFVSSLLVVPTEPATLYAAGSAPRGDDIVYFVGRSIDGGKTWKRITVELEPDERELVLLAASEASPSELLAKTTTLDVNVPERLLVSRDGGESFGTSTPATFTAIRSATFAPDGRNVYVADRLGLWRAPRAAGPFTKVGETALMAALRVTDDELYASGYFNGFKTRVDGIGVGAPDATTFSTYMRFADVRGLVTCAAPSTVATDCAQLWTEWELERPPGPAADAGAPDAGASRDGGSGAPATGGDGGGGCATRAPAHARGTGTLTLTLLALWLGARRRDRRSTPT